MNQWQKLCLAGMLAVAVAFGLAVPLGFWLRAQYRTVPDGVIAAIVVITLVAVAACTMALLTRALSRPHKRISSDGIRPDPDYVPAHPTGYEMTFHDFKRLLSERQSQPTVASLLKEWYGYEIAGQTIVRSPDGREVSLPALHDRIQGDPAKQYTIYQEAMNFWR
jgi:hypothetical protein